MSRGEPIAAAFPATSSPTTAAPLWRARASRKKVEQLSLPRVLKAKLTVHSDRIPPCTIELQQIVTAWISTGVASQAELQQRIG